MVELQGSVSVVTGAAAGIGRATALALAREGADVVVSDIDAAGLSAVAEEIEASGRKAWAVRADVGRREEVEALVRRSIDWQGRCDLFLSNAGIGCTGAAHEFSVADWERILDIDLYASIWAVRALVPHMLERGTGHLSFVSSGAGLLGGATYAPYCVAKFGLIGLAESLAKQLKDTGVSVSIVLPGLVSTSNWTTYMIAGEDEMAAEEVSQLREEQRTLLGNGASPESMADTIVDGLRSGRLYILQKHPKIDDWYADMMQRRGRDPDAFVLGD